MVKQKLLLATLVAGATMLAACGGGGGDSPTAASTATPQKSVAGPLDTVQSTLSSAVFGPLESATANTALAGVVKCANGAVTGNVLDIGDTVLNALANPSTAAAISAGIQVQVNQLAQNLKGLIASLASQGNCSQPAASGGNPLAGTALAPLGDQLLPVIEQVLSQTGSSNSNGFASLSTLVTQLDTALHTAIAQLPASATSAPIVGGTLTTLDKSLSDTAALLTALANNDGNALKAAVQNLLDNLLVNVLTGIVPVTLIETQAGKPGAISTPIQQAAGTFSSAVASALGAGTTPLLTALNSSQLAPVINPVVNGVLPALIAPLTKLLDSLGSASGTSAGGPTGTGLDALLLPVINLLRTVLGSPTSQTCIFASLPLVSVLCPK